MAAERYLAEDAAIPRKILSGLGCKGALADFVDSLGLERLRIVTGEKVRAGSHIAEEIASLLGRRISGVFDRARTHAPEKSIEEVTEYVFGLNSDGVLSIGAIRSTIRLNMEAAADKLGLAASVIGIPAGGRDAAEEMAERINELALRLEVPRTLRELRLPPEQFDAVARDAMRDPHIGWNLSMVTFHDIVSRLEEAGSYVSQILAAWSLTMTG